MAREATGHLLKPVWRILDDGEFELVLANAAREECGRPQDCKTDVNDAMWLAELLAHGLIRGELCTECANPGDERPSNLLRERKQLVREQSSHVLRVQKTLKDTNIKLDSVLTDVMAKAAAL